MNKPATDQPLTLPAVLALAAAAVFTAFAVRHCLEASKALDSDTATLLRLRQAGTALDASRQMQRPFDELSGKKLADLGAVFATNSLLPAPDERRQSSADLAPGWTVRGEEIVFRDVPVAAALRSCEAAETLRPPWRLARLVVRAAPQGKGRGHVLMSFEGIEATQGE